MEINNYENILSEYKIVKKSVKSSHDGGCFIYALIHEGEIVYIGQTRDIDKRMFSHKNDKGKVFDSYYVEAVDSSCIDEVETFLIFVNSPKYNVSKNENAKRKMHTPITHKEILRRLIENK